MCRPTEGKITPMSSERISRNFALTSLLGSLEQATQAVSRVKNGTMAVTNTFSTSKVDPSLHPGPRNHFQQQQQHHHTGGDSSTEDEHSLDSSGGGHPQRQNGQSSIATRVRRKRHSREQSKAEPTVQHQTTVQHHYHDFATSPQVKASADGSNQSKKSKGGIAFPFPSVLHAMLERADHEKFDDVVSWQPHGRAFTVHNPNRFVKEVMPLFFRQTRFASFQRQLSLYGFLRLTRKGPDHGAYYHELFVRGRSDLCQLMQRTRVKGSWVRQSSSPDTEPDFTSMPVVPKSSGKAIPKLPPLRNTTSATSSKHTASKLQVKNTATQMPALSSSSPMNYGNAQALPCVSYPAPTGFGWTNSSLVANMNGEISVRQQDSSQSKIPATSSHARGASRPYVRHVDSTTGQSYPFPMQQQYFEPPPTEQVALAAFLFDVGLDSDEELRKELSQYDTEPLPWNSPSNQTEL